MKNFNRIPSILFVLIFLTFSCLFAKAENSKIYYLNIDWQFNIPLGNDFTDVSSGWGMNVEGGFFIRPQLGIGAFLNYCTNRKYIEKRTFAINDNSALTTNQQRSLFQLPFGVAVRYKILKKNRIDPYLTMKLGPEYCQMSSYISTFKVYEKLWGFFLSPEIGTNLWLNREEKIGLNFSVYYNFSTCKGKVLDGKINNLSNVGFRVGLSF